LPIHLSVHLSVCTPSVYTSICLRINLSTHASVDPSVCPYICLSIYPSINPSSCLFVCLLAYSVLVLAP
jgi:hypothetical protein